jgi:hypothetical protein
MRLDELIACLLSSFPKAEVRAKLLEAPHLEVERGESLTLNCVMSLSNHSWQPLVIWQQNSRLISFDRHVRVLTRKVQSKSGQWYVHSQLRIQESESSNSGQYGCRMTGPGLTISSDQVHVRVLPDGQKVNAVKQNFSQQKAAFHDLDLSNGVAQCQPWLITLVIFVLVARFAL